MGALNLGSIIPTLIGQHRAEIQAQQQQDYSDVNNSVNSFNLVLQHPDATPDMKKFAAQQLLDIAGDHGVKDDQLPQLGQVLTQIAAPSMIQGHLTRLQKSQALQQQIQQAQEAREAAAAPPSEMVGRGTGGGLGSLLRRYIQGGPSTGPEAKQEDAAAGPSLATLANLPQGPVKIAPGDALAPGALAPVSDAGAAGPSLATLANLPVPPTKIAPGDALLPVLAGIAPAAQPPSLSSAESATSNIDPRQPDINAPTLTRTPPPGQQQPSAPAQPHRGFWSKFREGLGAFAAGMGGYSYWADQKRAEILAQAGIRKEQAEFQFKRQQLDEAQRQGLISPQDYQNAINTLYTGGPSMMMEVQRAKAVEQAKVDIETLAANNQREEALKRLSGIANILKQTPEGQDYLLRAQVALTTGIPMPAPKTVSPTQEKLGWALNAKAAEKGYFKADGKTPDPDRLTDLEKSQAVQEQAEGTLGQPPYDPTKVKSLPPGQKDESVLVGQPQNVVDIVKMLSNYAIPLPGGYVLARNPTWQKALQLMQRYDPSFNESMYPLRMATQRDFRDGKTANNLRSINTLIGHLSRLDKSGKALKNIPADKYSVFTGAANWVGNLVKEAKQDPRVITFNDDLKAVSDELSATFKNTGATDTEIRKWLSSVNSASSPEELHAHVLEAVELMKSRVDFIQSQYENNMQLPFNLRFLGPKAQKELSEITGTPVDQLRREYEGAGAGSPAIDLTTGAPSGGAAAGGGARQTGQIPPAVNTLLSDPKVAPGVHTLSDGSTWIKAADGTITRQ